MSRECEGCGVAVGMLHKHGCWAQKLTNKDGDDVMSEQEIESEIQAKELNAPRVTPEMIDAAIVSEHYFTAADGDLGAYCNNDDVYQGSRPTDLSIAALPLLTFCVLILRNGFTVTGESACASPENFDAEIGRKIAKTNARNKIWALEGYLLKEDLHVMASDS